ncbi:hypothetical protein Tco_0556436 [Tanacetum coccineum]
MQEAEELSQEKATSTLWETFGLTWMDKGLSTQTFEFVRFRVRGIVSKSSFSIIREFTGSSVDKMGVIAMVPSWLGKASMLIGLRSDD